MANGTESLILLEEKIKTVVWAYLTKVLIVFGITNVAAFLGMIVYITVTVPEKAIEIAMNQVKENISERIQMLQQDVNKIFKTLGELEKKRDEAFKDFDKLSKDLTSLKEQIISTNKNISELTSISIEEIDKAAKTLKLIREYESSTDLLAKIELTRQLISSLDNKLNRVLKGEEIVERFSAKEVHIVDYMGKERIFLGLRNLGEIGLFLLDTNGKNRASLTTNWFTAGGASLALQDSREKDRIRLGLYQGLFDSLTIEGLRTEYAGLDLIDDDGKRRMSLTTDLKNGRASLVLRNSREKDRVQLYENDAGYAGLGLIDSNAKWRMYVLTNPKDGLPFIEFRDSEGKIVKTY